LRHHIAEQLRGPAVNRQLVLQLGDPLPRRHQLGVISAGDARHLAAVDQLLPPPRVNHLRADLQVIRDLSDGTACCYQIENLPAELRRVTPRHNILQGC
jgi:hypothetical protein